ncbi:Bud site selection protein bud4 [Tulasnella sp. 424]|nr:Bud site selection protein bud4 [Tulasnella sp. 424]
MASPPPILSSQRPQSPPIRGGDKLKNSILANSQSGWTSTTVISPLKITKQPKAPPSPDATPSPPMSSNLSSNQGSPGATTVRRTSSSFSHVRNHGLVSNSPFIRSPTLDGDGGPLGAKFRPIPQSESGGYKVLPRPSKIPGVTPRKPSPSIAMIANRRVSPAQATRRASLERRKRLMENENFQKALAMEAAAMGYTGQGLGIISSSQGLGKKPSKGLSKVAELEFVSKSPFIAGPKQSNSTNTSPSLTSSANSSPQQSQPEESEDAEEPATPTTFEHQTPDIHVEDTSDGRATPDDEESPMALSEPSKSLPNTSLGVSPHPSRPLPASPRSRRAAAAFYDSSNQAPPSPPSPARRPGPQYSTPTPVRFIISSTPTPTKSSLKSKRRIRGPRSPELDGSFVVERTPSGRRRYGSLRRRHERRKTVTFDERCDVLEFEPDSDEDFVDSEWVTSEEEDAGPYYAEEAEEEVDQHEQHSDHGDDYEHEREQGYEDEPAPRSSEVDAIHGLVNSMIEDEMNEFNADNSMEAEYDQSGDSRHTLQFKSGEEANTSLDFHEGSNASVDFAAANTSLDFQEANTSLDFHEGDSFELRLQKATQNRCVDSDDQVEAEEEEEEETPQRSRQEAQGDLTVESAHLEYLASPSGTPQRRNNHNETSNQHNSPPSESAPVADSGSQAFLLGGKGQAFASGSTLGSTGSWSSHLVQSDSQSSLSGRASPRISREDVQRRLAEHRVGKAMLGDEEGQTESEGEDVPRRHTAAALTAFARRPHGNAEDGRPLPQLPASGSAERIQAPSMNRVPQSHDAVLQTTASQNTPDRPQSLPVERSLTTDGNLPQAAYNHPPAHPSLTRTYDITQPGVDIADVKSALDRLMIGVENGFLDDGSQAGSTNSRPGSFAGPSVPTQHPPIETVRSSYVLRSSTPLSMPPEDVDSSQELIASQLPSPAPPPKEDQTLAPSRPTSLVRVKSGKEILKEHEAHVIAKRREARRRENSIHGRPLSKRRSLSTSDAEGARRERKSFVGQAVELLDVPIDEVDLPLTDSIDRELRNLNEGEQPTYRLREREETIYASADDRVSHMTRAGDVNTGRAWRVVRRASDMNEYARQIRDWRNQDRSGRAHGKVFVKVLGLRDINVPLPNQPTDFTVTLNNGIHCVETPETRLDKECRVEQEFELIEHGQLEFTLTIKVRKDPHIVAQMQAINAPRITPSPAPPPIPVAPPPKGGFLSLFGGSKKSKTHKRAYTQPETILQQPPQSRHVDECFAKYLQPDGTLGTAFISFKDVARRCDTRLFETSYPLIGYSADDKRASSGLQLGEVVLQIFRLPPLPGVKPDQLPQSLEECHRGLRHIAWHKVMYHEGTLTQSGGDCKGWRRRHIKVIGANLVSFNDVTNRPTATIELKRAIAVVDNQDPNADPTSPIGSKPDEDETYNVERSFRLIFPGNEVIAFFADTDSDKSKWLDILRALIGRIPPNPLWAELVWQRQEEILSGAQPRPSVLASVTEGTPS